MVCFVASDTLCQVSSTGGPASDVPRQMSEAACEVWALGADPGQCEDVSSVVSIITSDIMMRAW